MYNNLHYYTKMEILGYLHIGSFMNVVHTNKENLKLCNSYLKMKKNIFDSEKIEKNHKNSLYILEKKYTRNELEKNVIVKIVRICKSPRESDKIKIYFWVLCKMGKVGEKYTIYPDWCLVKSIDPDKFIPFY